MPIIPANIPKALIDLIFAHVPTTVSLARIEAALQCFYPHLNRKAQLKISSQLYQSRIAQVNFFSGENQFTHESSLLWASLLISPSHKEAFERFFQGVFQAKGVRYDNFVPLYKAVVRKPIYRKILFYPELKGKDLKKQMGDIYSQGQSLLNTDGKKQKEILQWSTKVHELETILIDVVIGIKMTSRSPNIATIKAILRSEYIAIRLTPKGLIGLTTLLRDIHWGSTTTLIFLNNPEMAKRLSLNDVNLFILSKSTQCYRIRNPSYHPYRRLHKRLTELKTEKLAPIIEKILLQASSTPQNSAETKNPREPTDESSSIPSRNTFPPTQTTLGPLSSQKSSCCAFLVTLGFTILGAGGITVGVVSVIIGLGLIATVAGFSGGGVCLLIALGLGCWLYSRHRKPSNISTDSGQYGTFYKPPPQPPKQVETAQTMSNNSPAYSP